MSEARFARAIAALDALHAEDPARDAAGVPRELVYARRMSVRLEALHPRASEPLRLAVRCQHLQRWTLRREDYPAGAAGYRRWRTDEAAAHASAAARVLTQAGYDGETVARVQSLVRKEDLQSDPEAQALEDTSCLVFLEHELPAFAGKQQDPEKLVGILAKTWRKMSSAAREAALALSLAPEHRALVAQALERAGEG